MKIFIKSFVSESETSASDLKKLVSSFVDLAKYIPELKRLKLTGKILRPKPLQKQGIAFILATERKSMPKDEDQATLKRLFKKSIKIVDKFTEGRTSLEYISVGVLDQEAFASYVSKLTARFSKDKKQTIIKDSRPNLPPKVKKGSAEYYKQLDAQYAERDARRTRYRELMRKRDENNFQRRERKWKIYLEQSDRETAERIAKSKRESDDYIAKITRDAENAIARKNARLEIHAKAQAYSNVIKKLSDKYYVYQQADVVFTEATLNFVEMYNTLHDALEAKDLPILDHYTEYLKIIKKIEDKFDLDLLKGDPLVELQNRRSTSAKVLPFIRR